MAINTNTLESNLTTKINATSGTTEGKEFLLLAKAVEALTIPAAVQDMVDEGNTQVTRVTTEGNTQVAAVQAAGANYAQLSGADFTGNVTVAGNFTVSGTQTVINSATLTVDDLNITIADGAADAAAANGAGITVDGANANITYTSATDTWDFNKAIAGTYTNLHPVVNSNTAATGATTFDMNKPMNHFTMTGAATFTGVGLAAGKTSMMVLDTSSSAHTPSWGADIKWPDATEPSWADYRYWAISFTCINGVTTLAAASGYTV